MWTMGIDMGTSGCKAVVFDEQFAIRAQSYREYPMHLPGEGLLELDAELVWEGICAVIREANRLSPQPVGAVAVSAIGDVIIPVDEHGDSVRYSIVDFDPRGGEEITAFAKAFGEQRFFNINGMPPLYIGSLAKILYLKEKEPEVFARTRRFASYEDFIVNKMGLPPVASYSELSRTMLFDIRKKDWSDELLNAIPLSRDRLPIPAPSASVIGDTSWIKPGQTCWDWLNGIPFGPDVNFKSGINLDTYKYFVDFAARNGVGYMLMDEGWALDTRDPFTTNPEVHLPELIAYSNSKGVGLILWLPWLTVEKHMDLFEKFESWGIKGVKIDFMDRQDQWMVNFYERAAREAAKHHIFIDFHGAFHPSGLDYKYPNVLTFEGVRGMEFNGNCKPDNSVWLPFLRNAVGPMDYTPGSMLNYQPEKHHGNRPICSGVGTKTYNMAVFVLFESNLQMLMDNPCRYDQWPDCRDFLTGVPVNWDETRILQAEAGQYCITAKRRGNQWFIGGITNSTARDFQLKLDFLPAGKEYKMVSFSDGINADVIAMDYRREESKVTSQTVLPIHMVRNGGWCARIEME